MQQENEVLKKENNILKHENAGIEEEIREMRTDMEWRRKEKR